jgi:hypothetical protein
MIGFPAGTIPLKRFAIFCIITVSAWLFTAHATATTPAMPQTPALTKPAVKPDSGKTTIRHIPATGIPVPQKKDTSAKAIIPAAESKKDIIKEVIQEPLVPADTAKKDSGDIHVTVKSVPESVDIFIDGLHSGTTPFETGNLRAGTHTVELKAKGYKDFRKEIYFAPLSRKKITVRLASIYSNLSLRSVPSGADVSLNGAQAGVTPFDTSKVAPGLYTIAFSLANYLPYQAQVNAEQNKGDTITAVLVSKAYADSVKAASQKNRQIARRVLFGISFSGFALAGVLVNQTAQDHLNKETAARDNYSAPNQMQASYDSYWAQYKNEQNLATKAMQRRNVLYGIAGVFAIGVGLSIPF